MARLIFFLTCSVAIVFSLAGPACSQDDVADVPSQKILIGDDEHQQYFLVGPMATAKISKAGYGLIVVLPGGDGSADFLPFVKRIYKNALPDGYLLAEPVAPKWNEAQKIVWPVSKPQVDAAKFMTQDFVSAVIDDVAKREKVNPKRIFTLSWSSSGPAAYAASMAKEKVVGSFIAMSVFPYRADAELANAKDHAFYLYQSKDDKVCDFHFAEVAAKTLEENHAKVKLATYEGGHGWHGDVFDDIRAGFEWLEQNCAK